MRYLTILLVATVLAAAALGCKWSFGSNADVSTNSNNSNRSPSNNRNSDDDDNDYSSNSNSSSSNSAKDLTPKSIDVSEMTSGSDKELEGRLVTVTGGVLESIDSDKLMIRGQYGGAAFYCYGSFTDYLSMADRVRSLSQSGRAPKATVKGMYKASTVGTGGELDPCVLTDIQR